MKNAAREQIFDLSNFQLKGALYTIQSLAKCWGMP
jgi:hypothetical protein